MDAEESFREFVRGRSRALGRTAYLLTGDVHLAEDLLQTALYRAARRWPALIAGGSPEAYVRRILYNEHISWWRRRRVTETLTDALPHRVSGDAAGDPAGVPLRVAVERALAKLTPKQRAVLRYFEDLTEVQAADVLGVSVGTVKSQTRHALGRLRVLAPELAELVEEGA